MGPLPLTFVTSASKYTTLPDSPAEVAFIGRSNVGKSSLINAIANQRQLARVSKTPGRTQLINLFALGDGTTVVDLPGYGFANAPKQARNAWGAMTENYFLGRTDLRRIIILVDAEVGPTALDVSMLEWVRHHELPFAVVATKHDKVKSSARQKRKRELAAGCGLDERDVLWVSASKNVNIDLLRDRVRGWLHEAPKASTSRWADGWDDGYDEDLGGGQPAPPQPS
ncbi:MAG: ribosome biogenesis GTP-binding protein YihA/YsxC [Microthrixaceae bacterium]